MLSCPVGICVTMEACVVGTEGKPKIAMAYEVMQDPQRFLVQLLVGERKHTAQQADCQGYIWSRVSTAVEQGSN